MTSNDSKPRFDDGENVLCYHGPLLCKATCLKSQVCNKVTKYFIHYSGWPKSWDEWVPEQRVLKCNATNLQKLKKLERTHTRTGDQCTMPSSSKRQKIDVKEINELLIIPDISIKKIEWKIPNFDLYNPCVKTYSSPYFPVSNGIWQLRLCPNLETPRNEQCTSLHLKKYNNVNYSVEYYLGIKNSCGCIEQIRHGILEKSSSEIVYPIIKRELFWWNRHLVPDDILTIVCTMKIMNNPTQEITSNETKSFKLRGLDKLSSNFKDLFENEEGYDVILKVKNKQYKAHWSVLTARSKVFADTFGHDTKEEKPRIITVLDCDPDSFQKFLVYLYSGQLENLSVNSAMSLYYTADKYYVEELKEFCIEYLMQCLSVENFCEIAMFAEKCNESVLINFVQYFFNENAGKIFKSSEWTLLMKEDSDLASKLLIEMSKMKPRDSL